MPSRPRKPSLGDLDQPSLLPADELFPEQRPVPIREIKRRRPRTLDEPVLNLVAHFEVITTYALLTHFFVNRARSVVYGYRLLKQLRERGLIAFTPIYPELGKASMNAVSLTAAGWRMLGQRPPSTSLRPMAPDMLRFKLQYAEMMIQRASEGWREIKPDKASALLKKWALASYKNRMLNEYEMAARNALERMPDFDFPLPMLYHKGLGWIRIILPAQPGKSFKRILESLPNFSLMPKIPYELVCGDSEKLEECKDLLAKHASKHKYRYRLAAVPHFNTRPNPRNAALAVPMPQQAVDPNASDATEGLSSPAGNDRPEE